MKMLSILISYYNNSKYLGNLKKIIEQNNYKDREIVIVDDGSDEVESQKLEMILNKIAQKNLIFIKNKINMGPGFTKNLAVHSSTGKYVIFLDSDDFVDGNYYSEIIKAANLSNPELVCTDIIIKKGRRTYLNGILKSNIIREKGEKISPNSYLINQKHLLGNQFSASACNKAIKREILSKFAFNENKCDDLTAIIPAICQAKNIIYLTNVNYYYVQNDNSLTRGNNLNSLYDSLQSLFKTVDILKKMGVNESRIELFFANNVIPFIKFNVFENNEIYRLKLCKFLKNLINSENFLPYLVTKNPYLYRLDYIDNYILYLFSLLERKKFLLLNFVVIKNKVIFRIRKLLGGKK